MKILIEKEIESCAECPHLQAYKLCNASGTRTQREMNWRCTLCHQEIAVGQEPESIIAIPQWCPAAAESKPKKVDAIVPVKLADKVAHLNGAGKSVSKSSICTPFDACDHLRNEEVRGEQLSPVQLADKHKNFITELEADGWQWDKAWSEQFGQVVYTKEHFAYAFTWSGNKHKLDLNNFIDKYTYKKK